MKKIGKINPRTILGWISLGLGIAKVFGDFRRHGRHETHNQQCACFSQCPSCVIDAHLS